VGGVEGPDASALADVPKSLPALARAAKLGRRAARVGFDWQEASQVRDKVLEEIAEVDQVLAAPTESPQRLAEELGDLLFAIANWTLHLKVDPEEALRAANAKFERRFRRMEALASSRGRGLQSLDAAEWDDLWRQAKQQES
jgi:nucleoside triphosphate diphosphatase